MAWLNTGSMNSARSGHTATLLLNGKVLIAGGINASGYLASAELYDPVAGNFTSTGALRTARSNHTATLLPDGSILIAGGNSISIPAYPLGAEVYDTATGIFTPGGPMINHNRFLHTATSLLDGKVLIAGGWNDNLVNPIRYSSAELYDPIARAFTATTAMREARSGHTATLLSNGNVLVAGGVGTGGELASAELFRRKPPFRPGRCFSP